MKNTSCCFTGHRAIQYNEFKQIKPKLKNVIVDLIENEYINFYTGGAIGFDTECAKLILELKQTYAHIQLHLILPCKNQTCGWSVENIKVYEEIKQKSNSVTYTSDSYCFGCMYKRNRKLVDSSNICIAYLVENKGGTYYTVQYAQKQKVKVINIFQDKY